MTARDFEQFCIVSLCGLAILAGATYLVTMWISS